MAKVENIVLNSDKFKDDVIKNALDLYYSKNEKLITVFHTKTWKKLHFNYLKNEEYTGKLNVTECYDKIFREFIESARKEGLKIMSDESTVEEILDYKLYGLKSASIKDEFDETNIEDELDEKDEEGKEEEKNTFPNSFNGKSYEFDYLKLLVKNAAINRAARKDYKVYANNRTDNTTDASNSDDEMDDMLEIENSDWDNTTEDYDILSMIEVKSKEYSHSITDFIKGKSKDELIKMFVDTFSQHQYDTIKRKIELKHSGTKTSDQLNNLIIGKIKKSLRDNLKLQIQQLKVKPSKNPYLGSKQIEKLADKGFQKKYEFINSISKVNLNKMDNLSVLRHINDLIIEEDKKQFKMHSIISRFLLSAEIITITELNKSIKDILIVDSLIAFNTKYRFKLFIST